MEGEFTTNQKSFDTKKYVMIDWDETMSLNPSMVAPLFALFSNYGFKPMIFTYRRESGDNDDIFAYVKESDVLFSDHQQKKDALSKYGILKSQVAFWIDDNPSAIVDKMDISSVSNRIF